MVSEVFFQNANNNYQNVVNDYSVVKGRLCKNKNDDADAPIFCALKTIAPVRRVLSAEDEIKQGNALPALGCASLMLINAREDLRDLGQAWEQSKAFFTGKKYVSKYLVPDGADYKDYQHAFSAIRGTDGLESWVKNGITKGNKLAITIGNLDQVLSKTRIGAYILSKICVDINYKSTDVIKTKIEAITSTKVKPKFINAFNFKGKGYVPIFGEMTAKAMTRTTKLGILILALLEAPKIIKEMTKGETIGEQAKNTAKQTAISGINVASITTGMAYGGALGHKLAGPTGSLIGMGCGAIFGSNVTKKAKEIMS